MEKLKRKSVLLRNTLILIGSLAGLCSCGLLGSDDDGGDDRGINPDIVRLIDCCRLTGDTTPGFSYDGDFFMAVWRGDRILSTAPILEIQLKDDLEVDSLREIFWRIVEQMPDPRGLGTYLDANADGTKLLLVKSTYADVSSGALYEYEPATDRLRLLLDSTLNVSSARYWPGDDARVVYYRYGEPAGGEDYGTGAGYYALDLATGRDSLLLSYLPPRGRKGRLVGFDVHPDGTKLLLPDVRFTLTEALPPRVVEYDLQTRAADTLAVDFDPSFVRFGLWLRYSPDGRQILYANFPLGVYGDTTNDDSEVGIIDRASERKRVLDVSTNNEGVGLSVELAPTWSPDGRHIVYGSGPLSIEGARGTYSLYVLKDVNEP